MVDYSQPILPSYPGYPAPDPLSPPLIPPPYPGTPPGGGYPPPYTMPDPPMLSPPKTPLPNTVPAIPRALTVSEEAQALLEELLQTSNDPVTVLHYCFDHGVKDEGLSQRMNQSLSDEKDRLNLELSFQPAKDAVLSQRSDLVNQMTTLIAHQKDVRRVSGTGSPDDQEITRSLTLLGNELTELNHRLDQVEADEAAALKALPLPETMTSFFPLYVSRYPGSVVRAISVAIEAAEDHAKSGIAALDAETTAKIEADKADFQNFIKDETEKRLAPAQEKIDACQTLITSYQKMKADADASFQAKKAAIDSDTQALKEVLAKEFKDSHPAGFTEEDAKKIQIDDIKAALNSYYSKDQSSSDGRAAIRLLNNLTNIDFELSEKEALFKQAAEQIKIGQDALEWAKGFYASESEKINSPYFEAECKKLWNDQKTVAQKLDYARRGLSTAAQQAEDARVNSYRYQFNVIYSHVLDQKRRMAGLYHRLEGESLKLEGMKLPAISAMVYETKKLLKRGAEHYQNMLTDTLTDVHTRFEDGDKSRLTEDRQAVQLVRAASWCLDELLLDLDFQSQWITEQAAIASQNQGVTLS